MRFIIIKRVFNIGSFLISFTCDVEEDTIDNTALHIVV